MGIAKEQKVEALKESSVETVNTQVGGTDPKTGAKVLVTGNNAGGSAGPEATTIVSAVSGEEILAAIVGSQENDASTGVAGNTASSSTSAVSFAKGGTHQTNIANNGAKAAAGAGGIALRSLTKSGKLASHNSNDEKAVQSAEITAVNKLLGAVEDIIKKTVKNVLEKAKGEIDKAKASKSTVQQ